MAVNTDLMIDLETLDTSPTATILTIGAVRFDPFNNDVSNPACKKLYLKVDIESCEHVGGTTSESVLEWWAFQSTEAQDEAFSSRGRVSIEEAINRLYKFAWGAKRVWSHGAAFDIPICEFYFQKVGRAIPWKYYEVRCTRTLFDIGVDPARPPVLKHHALEDAWNQVIGVQNVFRTLGITRNSSGNLDIPILN